MTKTNTRNRIVSILLALVMLLSLLPTTALAATYPDTVRVYNASGAITSLDDGQCLVTNDASATAIPAAPMSPATRSPPVRCTSRTTTALRQMAKFMRTAT